MTQSKPLVSIIMPVYNGSLFVAEAIESILKQSYPHFELIIVDDGSTDTTWKILKTYRKQNPKIVHTYRFSKNQGESAAANYAFTKSRGDFIARMDADDVAHTKRLEKQVSYMQKNPQTILLGAQAKVIDKNGRIIGHKSCPTTHESIYQMLAYINPMIHPSVMYRRSLLPDRNYLYHNKFESTDDYHTYFELLKYGTFANLPEQLLSYRIHGANKSLTNMKEKFWTDTKVRFYAMRNLGYQAPVGMFLAITLQAMVVSILPERIIRELFFIFRGIHQIRIHVPKHLLSLINMRQSKRYALKFK